MGQILPSFLFDLESNMRVIASNRYSKLQESGNLWYQGLVKLGVTGARKERIIWLLESLKIARPNASHGGGQQKFVDIVSATQEIEVLNALPEGLELKKEELEDTDGQGVKLAAHWAGQASALAAYWPQKATVAAINANPVGYDLLTFFSGVHPYNPFDSAAGTYANLHKTSGGATGAGAVPIDTSVSVEVALQNLQKVIAYVAGIKQPNGEDPRFLRLVTLYVPTPLEARAVQLTNAKFIAQIASSGAGSADVEAMVKNMAFKVVVAPELGAAYGGSDTTYYIGCEDILSDELGALLYIEREPFSIVYHGPMTSAELARIRKFQWTCEGRNVIAPGHPFLLHKCMGA